MYCTLMNESTVLLVFSPGMRQPAAAAPSQPVPAHSPPPAHSQGAQGVSSLRGAQGVSSPRSEGASHQGQGDAGRSGRLSSLEYAMKQMELHKEVVHRTGTSGEPYVHQLPQCSSHFKLFLVFDILSELFPHKLIFLNFLLTCIQGLPNDVHCEFLHFLVKNAKHKITSISLTG